MRQHLDNLLREGESHRRRLVAAKLGDLGDISALLPLLDVAENAGEPDWLRVTALDAAAWLGDPRTAGSAIRILQTYTPNPEFTFDPSSGQIPELECMACQVISRLGDVSMTAPLLALLDDRSPQIHHAAIKALGAVADSTALARLEELQQSDDASVPVEEQHRVAGMVMAGTRLVPPRVAAAEAVRRILRRTHPA